jgi:hypothetical protein
VYRSRSEVTRANGGEVAQPRLDRSGGQNPGGLGCGDHLQLLAPRSVHLFVMGLPVGVYVRLFSVLGDLQRAHRRDEGCVLCQLTPVGVHALHSEAQLLSRPDSLLAALGPRGGIPPLNK